LSFLKLNVLKKVMQVRDLGPPHKGDLFAAICKNIAFGYKIGWSEIGNLSISL